MSEKADSERKEILKWIEDLRLEENSATDLQKIKLNKKMNMLKNITKDMDLRKAIYDKVQRT